jgi:hypothetical protein
MKYILEIDTHLTEDEVLDVLSSTFDYDTDGIEVIDVYKDTDDSSDNDDIEYDL